MPTPRVNTMHHYGRGPWRILPDCPAPTSHNTLRAAWGQDAQRVVTKPGCVCPRALDLKRAAEGRREEYKKTVSTFARRKSTAKLQPVDSAEISARTPDFSRGLCARPENLSIADMGLSDQATHRGIERRQIAKDLCEACPLKRRCQDWVTTQESPAGSWGGVWGGLDPWNRRGETLIIKNGLAEVIPYVG